MPAALRRLLLSVLVLCPAACKDESASAPSPLPFLERIYTPHMPKDDPLSFPLKIQAISDDPYTFWRGAKPLFHVWAKAHAPHWLADETSFVLQHGDPHFGNLGAYLVSGPRSPTLAFGLVDFDDAHRAPVQLELLQGLVNVRLVAAHNEIELSDKQLDRLVGAMLDTYAAAAAGDESATQLLGGEKIVRKLLDDTQTEIYAETLEKYAVDEGFVPTVGKKKNLKDLLTPAPELAEPLATALARAAEEFPELRGLLRAGDAGTLRKGIKDVALRTRLGSGGSQGLRKYFVLLDKSVLTTDHDLILYLKQQIPSSAELAGVLPPDERDPARRWHAAVEALTDPGPFLAVPVTLAGRSYSLSLAEPWSKELDTDDIKSFNHLVDYVHVWACATGATHRAERGRVEAALTPALGGELKKLSGDFIASLHAEYRGFVDDARTQSLIQAADRALKSP